MNTQPFSEKEKSREEIFEGIAFQFCKIATVALIAGRFVLPVASGLCAIFFLAAYFSGKRNTRCSLKHPVLIAALYGSVSVVSLWWMLRPR